MNEANSSSLAKLNRLLAVCRLKQRRYGVSSGSLSQMAALVVVPQEVENSRL